MLPRRPELIAAEFQLIPVSVQAETLTSRTKSGSKHIGVRASPALPDTKPVVIMPAATCLFDKAHDVFCAVRKVRGQPLHKQGLYLVWQSQKDVTCVGRTDASRSLENMFDFVVVNCRDDRRDKDAGWYAVLASIPRSP